MNNEVVVTKEEKKKKYLEVFFDRYKDLQDLLKTLNSLLGCSYEGKLNQLIDEFTDDYVKILSKLTEVSTDDIFWYMFDCKLGEKPMMASTSGEDLILVDSVDALLQISEWK